MSELRIAVLISGSGSNLQALIDAISNGELAARIGVVFSNNDEAYGLERARMAGIPTEVLSHRAFERREDYDAAVAALLSDYTVDLLVLAGFMRILSPAFVGRFAGRILNIHPSLLPKFAGLDTHQRALEAGETHHGCTVHFVTATLDGGPPIVQGDVPVKADDTAQTLAARVLEIEHKIYPIAVSLFAAGRLRFANNQAWLDDAPLTAPLRYRDGELRSAEA